MSEFVCLFILYYFFKIYRLLVLLCEKAQIVQWGQAKNKGVMKSLSVKMLLNQ